MNFLLFSFLISLAIQIILFIPAFLFKTDKLTDLSYGLTFILLAFIGFISGSESIGRTILFVMISLWALRLISYLFIRVNKVGKDSRFDGIRESFSRFIKFWFGQGVIVWLVSLSSILAFAYSDFTFNTISYVGAIIFASGLIIETIADWQKFQFKKDKKNAGRWTDVGLWNYSRHPNYFGEMLVWIGIWIYVASMISLKYALIGLLSPAIIIVILLFVTGIPTPEKKYDERYAKNKEYKKYKQSTSKVILWFKK